MTTKAIAHFITRLFPDFEERLKDCINASDLTEREKFVLTKRLFEEKTLAEVGKEMEITRERVRQIEAKTYRKLRHPMYRNTFLDDFKEIEKSEVFHSYRRAFYDSIFNKEEAEKEKYPPYKTALEAQEERYLNRLDIEEMDFTVRTYNLLKRQNINTLADLAKYPIEELRKIKNMGEKSIDEIINKTQDLTLFKWEIEQ